MEIGRRSIGVFNVAGSLYAIKNSCPHQGAELCRGTIGGTMLPTETPGQYNYALDGRILRCPWHFWEFDITTGEMIFVPNPKRVKSYDVVVESTANAVVPTDVVATEGAATIGREVSTAVDTSPATAEAAEMPRLERYDVVVEKEIVVLYL